MPDINHSIYVLCDDFLVHLQTLEYNLIKQGYEFHDPLQWACDVNLVPSAGGYLIRMWQLLRIDREGLIHMWASAFFYLNSLMLLRRVSINARNFGTMMVGALILAMKMEYDIPYDNKSFAILTTNHLPTGIINAIEDLFINECGLTNEEVTDSTSPFPVICGAHDLYLGYVLTINKIFNGV